jgi:hypothetical protein
MGASFARDRHAMTAPLAFIVSGVVFLSAIGTALYFATLGGSQASGDGVDGAGRHTAAQSLAAVLVDSPGEGWEGGADAVTRLGLGAAGGALDPASLEALRGALYAATPSNGKVDYEEALASLGLTEQGLDFHIRISPIGSTQADRIPLDGLRTAYIGDWTGLSSTTVAIDTLDAMLAAGQAGVDAQMASQTANERAALVELGLDIRDDVFLTTSQPAILVNVPLLPDPPLLTYLGLPLVEGDVYPDHKPYLDAVFADRIGLYDVLIVGSQVDQSTLTTSVTKFAIRDWVLAGGLLIVMGSDSQNYQWLQPLFSVGVTTVNGGTFAPDPLHPMLKSPNDLQWQLYDNHDLGWDLSDQGANAHYEDFVHVVTEDSEDVLTYSKTGAFGDGYVMLTTWRPKEIHAQLGAPEGIGLVENMLTFLWADDLRLDYGPMIPGDADVRAAVRTAVIHDPTIGTVPVEVIVHVWQGR